MLVAHFGHHRNIQGTWRRFQSPINHEKRQIRRCGKQLRFLKFYTSNTARIEQIAQGWQRQEENNIPPNICVTLIGDTVSHSLPLLHNPSPPEDEVARLNPCRKCLRRGKLLQCGTFAPEIHGPACGGCLGVGALSQQCGAPCGAATCRELPKRFGAPMSLILPSLLPVKCLRARVLAWLCHGHRRPSL